MRFIWLLVFVCPWLVAASFISKLTMDQTQKYSSKEDFMMKLLKDPRDEEILILMEGDGAAAAKGGRGTALIMESVDSEKVISNVLVEDSVGGRLRRQVVDQEDIRRVLCRAATVGEFFRLLHFMLCCFWIALGFHSCF